MTKLALMLVACALLFSGCATRAVIPDPTVPHRVAEETAVVVWAQRPDGRWVKARVRLLAGDWIASSQIIEQP